MTMYNALHPRDDENRLYVTRKERRLINIENCVESTIQIFEEYTKNNKKYWLQQQLITELT